MKRHLGALLGPCLLNACTLLSPAPLVMAPGPQQATETSVAHRQDGTIMINNRPFFPFGFYHVSWAAGGTIDQRLGDLKKLGSSGFNLLITEPLSDQDVTQYSSFLESARSNGVYVLSYGLSLSSVARVEHEPSVLGFKLADDSNALTTPQQILQRRAAIKKIAPNKLTYISLSVGYDRPETRYFGVSDMVGNQSYPIGDDNINVVYNVMRSTVTSALAHNTVPIANLQTFAWSPGRPLPSAQELHNMTYQALMAGVKGVVYYAYRSKEVDLNQQPQLWSELQQLSQQVSLLAPSLLISQRTELADGRASRPLVVTFRGRGGNYLMALNNSRSQLQEVKVKLPGRVLLTPLFGTDADLTVSTQTVQGHLKPLEVAIYSLN